MPKVRFNRKPETGHIILVYRHIRGKLPFRYYTGQHCPEKHWNPKTNRAKASINYPEGADLNNLLNHIESAATSMHRQRLTDGHRLDNQDLKTMLDELLQRSPAEQRPTLAQFVEALAAERAASRNPVAETIANWENTAKTLHRYQSDRRRTVELEDVDTRLADDFRQWWYAQGFAVSSAEKYLSIIKAAVNVANDRKLCDNQAVNVRKFIRKPPKASKHALHANELATLAAFDWGSLTDNVDGCTPQRLERMADFIVAACRLGPRASDMGKIAAENIRQFNGMKFINLFTKKTDTGVDIPLLPDVERILQKYDWTLPKFSRQSILTVGRIALRTAGIHRTVTLRSTAGGKAATTTGRICDHFSAHVTRRTFATEFYLMDNSLLPAIQRIMGHSTPNQTLDYMDLEGRLTAEHFAKRIEIAKANEGRLHAVK